ncbi:NADH:flavin oxidoreductase [Methanoregula sp.]|uniref:NADH:flavin oxidoreductase n=1 Tax=Methanoregula sp. TaxID=2052170 RepID=UPI00236D2D23|nr:NADH:flavin oxidoreductase [Methanoregula sp.]MDD1686789.1 NADH:flavin oxidoreductase [Methanoregula sp.]
MKTLFDETCIGTMQLRNRLVRSATWEAMADETGLPTPRLIGVYQDLALGGTGLIISSATTITGDAARIPGMLAIPDDTCIPAYRELTRTVHDAGAPVVMQLVFPGRNGIFWTPGDPTCDDIQSIIKGFGDAALRAQQAGFNGVEIHAAHGYFLSQFMNARKNTRTDEYGGTVRNRIRFLREIMSDIRAKTGESFPILVKINCSDFEEDDGVWDACREACRQLAKQGISAIEVSGGIHGTPFPPEGLPYEESVFRDHATEIARITGVPVILVGMNRTPAVMTELLNTTDIGYFALSRPFLRQPGLANHWRENPDEPAECLSCDACRNQPDGNVCPFREFPEGET